MSAPITGIILAAGVGSRLRPLTDDRPKCLVSLGRETILGRAVRLLHEAGVRRLVVATGYLAPTIHDALRDAPMPVAFAPNPAFDRTQNVVSLALALDLLAPDESFLKLDGDVIFHGPVLRAVLAANAEAAVAVDSSGALGHEEMKVLVEAGRVVRFGKGLDPARAHGESIGIECFRGGAARAVGAAIRAAVAAGRTDQYYEDVYNDVLAGAEAVEMAPVRVSPDDWTEVDDLADLERARALFG